MDRHWWQKRTAKDAPIYDSVWESKREAWADGYNEAVNNYKQELHDALKKEMG